MSRHIRSDKTGAELTGADAKVLEFDITFDSNLLDEPLHYHRHWDLSTAEATAVATAWQTMKQELRAAVRKFEQAVDG